MFFSTTIYLLQIVRNCRGIGIREKYILTFLLLAIALLGVVLLFLYLTHPLTHETFTVAWNTDIVKELNLKSGDNVFVWLWTAPPLSMQNAGGRVIRFYITDPHTRVIAGYMPGIAGTGFFAPFTFVAQQDGVYRMYFENSIGDSDSRTVSLYYKITMSILGVPIDYVLICIIVIVAVVTVFLGIVFTVSKERTARPEVNPSNSGALTQALSKRAMTSCTELPGYPINNSKVLCACERSLFSSSFCLCLATLLKREFLPSP